jgi:hypothetical protein
METILAVSFGSFLAGWFSRDWSISKGADVAIAHRLEVFLHGVISNRLEAAPGSCGHC